MNQTIDIKEGCKKLIIDFDSKTVVQEFEAEFIPQDGDFVVTKNGSIFVYKTEGRPASFKNVQAIPYFGLINGKELDFREYPITEAPNVIRYATESERQQLLDALAKEGKTWNAEKKVVEKLRFKAKIREYYFLLDSEGDVETCQNENDIFDSKRFKLGNYFRTFKEAEQFSVKVRELFKSRIL